MDYCISQKISDTKNLAVEKNAMLKMSRADQQWIGETLFVRKNKIKGGAESMYGAN